MSRDLAGACVLLVEDDAASRDLLTTVLEQCGATVIPVASADAALEVLRTVVPEVVATEVAMPRHDGYWLLREIRRLPRGAALPVVGMSGSLDRDTVLASGFTAHVGTPVDPDQLCRLLASLLAP